MNDEQQKADQPRDTFDEKPVVSVPAPKAVITSGPVVKPAKTHHITLDGVKKSFHGSATGKELHKLAGAIDGFPSNLKHKDGAAVPCTDEPIELKQGQEFTTS